jgi:magnesium and cobalt transporter
MAEDGRPAERRSWLSRLKQQMSGEPQDRQALVKELREATERGLVDADALEMLEGVLAVGELHVRDIMVPRSQMTVVERDAAPDKLLPVVVESGHSRFPVIGEDRDQVVGILLAKDLLRYYAQNTREDFDIREVVRPAVFVPESKRLNMLLKEFRKSRHHMAIVVDEYGGVAGLVTVEDVIEQIVGDIADEYDVEEDQPIRREGERQFTVRGLTRIVEFNDYFSTGFGDEEFDTIGGLVAHAFGRLPRRGESVRIGEFEFRVLRADRRRIDLMRVMSPRDVVRAEEPGAR